MKYIVLSDIHFGLNGNNPVFYDINLELFRWIKEIGQERGIDHVLIAGDVFHDRSKITTPTLKNCFDCFNLWNDFFIKIIPGNHDCYYRDDCRVHSLDMFKNWNNIQVYDDITYIMVGGKKIGLIPWVGSHYDQILEICDIIVGHFELVGFQYGQTLVLDGTSPKIFEGTPLVITGHFHKHQDKTFQNVRVYYTGSPYEHNWGELEKKYVHILDTDTGELEKIENTISPKHIWVRDITNLDQIQGNFVKVVLQDEKQEEYMTGILEKEKPLNISIERVLDAQTESTITDFKNVDILGCIDEFITNLNEDDSIKEKLREYNKNIYEKVCSR